MEELRSTEILDREIQDDARRKAEKILKAGESECRAIAEEAAARTEVFRMQKEAEYAGRIDACRRDSEAAVPLEKQRKLVRFTDNAVRGELDRWFDGIGERRRLALFAGLLERYKTVLGESKLNITCRGYSPEAIRELAAGIFGGARIGAVNGNPAGPGEAERTGDGFILETEDGHMRCRATLAEIRDELLSLRRGELATALFGGRLGE